MKTTPASSSTQSDPAPSTSTETPAVTKPAAATSPGNADFLILGATILVRDSDTAWKYAPTSACRFQVSADGADLQPTTSLLGTTVFHLPPSPRPLPVTITATPTDKRYWPAQQKFTYSGGGDLKPVGDFRWESNPASEDAILVETAAFRHAVSVAFPKLKIPWLDIPGATAVSVQIHLSRVREVTDKAAQILGTNWTPNPISPSTPIAATPWTGGGQGRLDFQPVATLAPQSLPLIWELPGEKAPLLIGMWWPYDAQMSESAKTSFLLYFRPHLGQEAAAYQGAYPWTNPYVYFVLRRDGYYETDPLTDGDGAKGLDYQREAAGKYPVLIIPVPSLNQEPEMGLFMNAEEMEWLLLEMTALIFRRVGCYEPPAIDRVALSCFSNGSGIHLYSFLSHNRDHSFLKNFVKELYLLDPRMASAALVNEVLHWANLDSANNRVRVYLTWHDPEYARLFSNFSLPAGSFFKQSDDGHRSLLVTASADWRTAARVWGASKKMLDSFDGPNGWGVVHELQAAMMICHALRNSAFPDMPPGRSPKPTYNPFPDDPNSPNRTA